MRIDKLVSVIVPSFNHEKFILEALESIYKQSYRNIELIIIDDFSTDSTYAVARSWLEQKHIQARFTRIVIKANATRLGAHASINKGLSLAQGVWLTILNSDDRYSDSRIQILVESGENTGAELIFTGVKVIDEEGNRFSESPLAAEIESAIETRFFFPTLSFAFLKRNIAISTGNLFFARDVLSKIGEFRPFRYCHDWDFVLRVCLHSEPHAVIDPLYEYRIHSTNSFGELKFEQFLEPLVIYFSYFKNIAARNFTNPCAPTENNWPELFTSIIIDDPSLKVAYQLVAQETVHFNQMGQMIRNYLKI